MRRWYRGRGRVAQQDSTEHWEGNIKTFPVSSQFVSGSAELVWAGLGIRTCAIMPGSEGGEEPGSKNPLVRQICAVEN